MVGRISYSFLPPLISDKVQTESHCFFFNFFIVQKIKNNVFWYVTPCSLVEVYGRFEGPSVNFYFEGKVQQGNKEEANRVYVQLAYYWTLKMAEGLSSVKLVIFCQILRRHVPEDTTYHNHCRQNHV
jgi:hypothetical protein